LVDVYTSDIIILTLQYIEPIHPFFRIGHTWINPSLIGASQVPQVPLVDEFFSPEITHRNGSDGLLVSLVRSQCPDTDRYSWHTWT